MLDQEIGRLPERFRAAVVLCYLEGKSVDEAAVLLGCPRGTVASRLARRGSACGSASPDAACAGDRRWRYCASRKRRPRPLSLIPGAHRSRPAIYGGGAAANCGLSPRITTLTEEVLSAMFLHKLKTGIVILIAFAGILLVGGGLALGLRANAGPEAEPPDTGKVSKAHAAERAEQAG